MKSQQRIVVLAYEYGHPAFGPNCELIDKFAQNFAWWQVRRYFHTKTIGNFSGQAGQRQFGLINSLARGHSAQIQLINPADNYDRSNIPHYLYMITV
ncbi:MAG: hypothetical protein LBP22_10575 [Deltaproteobacteria bacterium]|nr:hypothetical protein [Deltaproteobacteria bacterium]